jgi:hypothetical protein
MTMPSSEITMTELPSRVNWILLIGWHVEPTNSEMTDDDDRVPGEGIQRWW